MSGDEYTLQSRIKKFVSFSDLCMEEKNHVVKFTLIEMHFTISYHLFKMVSIESNNDDLLYCVLKEAVILKVIFYF